MLNDRLLFGVFAQLRACQHQLEDAAELLEQAQEALRQDEIHVALAERLRDLAVAGQALVRASTIPPHGKTYGRNGGNSSDAGVKEPDGICPTSGRPPDNSDFARGSIEVENREVIERALSELRKSVEHAFTKAPGHEPLVLTWQLVRKG